MDFSKLLENNYILLDGGFGTELIRRGLSPDEISVNAVFDHSELVYDIHKSYADAGADIIYADTFGANRYKAADSGHTVKELVDRAVSLARKAAGNEKTVALDISTLGKILEPAGELTFREAYEAFSETVICGKAAGADIIALETFTDLAEARIALLAAKENSDLPVMVTLSFDENGKTMNGSTAGAAATALICAGASAVGVNCALGPDRLGAVVKELLKYSTVPVIVKPNAGLPSPVTNEYSMSAKAFAEIMSEYYKDGVKLLGGCCGTTPEFIKELKRVLGKTEIHCAEKTTPACVSGLSRVVTVDLPRIIGERINPTGKKRFREALENDEIDYIVNQAIEQVNAGAEILDINVGAAGIDEKKMMARVVKAVCAAVGVPLQIDSTSPEVIEAGLRSCTGKAIVNSVNAAEESLSSILPIVKRYGAAVVGLTLDENGIPETADGRVRLAEKIINRAAEAGIDKEDIYIDCLTLTVSSNQDSAEITLEALKKIKNQLGVKTVLGVSNISFGLPSRETVNAAFLTLALKNGLDLPIINPNSAALSGAFRAFLLLSGHDENGASYIAHSVNSTAVTQSTKELTLSDAVEKGLSSEAARLTAEALTQKSGEELISDILIPALDRVGVLFENGTLFLPQLIMSASAAGACFDIIKAEMSKNSEKSKAKGTVVIATVKGDIHDIGKNIVRTVLENYGYNVIDLGKDVSADKVLCAVKESGAGLAGLSALMTTTLPAMEKTVKLLRESAPECKIMVGGAVLTADYAEKIGADFYASDAKASADIAKKVFGN